MTTAAPSAMEMSKTIIDKISTAMNNGGDDADAARAALAEVLKGQGGAMAAAAAPAPTKAPAGAFTCADPIVVRPNGAEYHVRKIGIHDDIAFMREMRKQGIPVMLSGPPGTGKTALIEAAYASEPGGLYTVQGTGDTDVYDFVGSYIQLPSGQYEWVDGPLLEAMEKGGAFYVDEAPLVDPKVLAGLYSVMDGRNELRVTQNPSRGIVKASPGFYVVAACNPNAPGARMSEALTSRFSTQFEVTTDWNLAKRMGVNAKMVTAAQNMQHKVEKGTMGWAPQLRELLAFQQLSDTFGEEIALRNVIMTAPENDRDQCQDVLSRGFSKKLVRLKVSDGQ